jgi:hypothetical protein
MALFKYLMKEKDKLVEGEEFVKANELVEEINESRGGDSYFHRSMTTVNKAKIRYPQKNPRIRYFK